MADKTPAEALKGAFLLDDETIKKLNDACRAASEVIARATAGIRAGGLFGLAYRGETKELAAQLYTTTAGDLERLRSAVNRLDHAVRYEQSRRDMLDAEKREDGS
jgi:hypothetical protein